MVIIAQPVAQHYILRPMDAASLSQKWYASTSDHQELAHEGCDGSVAMFASTGAHNSSSAVQYSNPVGHVLRQLRCGDARAIAAEKEVLDWQCFQ